MIETEFLLAPRRLEKEREDNLLLLWILRRGGQSINYMARNAHGVGFFLPLSVPAKELRISVSAAMFFRL